MLFRKILLITFGLLLIIFAILFATANNISQNNGTITPLVSSIKKVIPYRFSENNKSKNKSKKVPILLYHYVRIADKTTDPTGWNLSVTPENFALQMSYLKAQNYQTLTFDDIDYLMAKKQNFPEKPIILTFDDGYNDFYQNAFPILKQYSFSAVVFMIGGKINQENYLSTDQIILLNDYGIEFGLHTQSHINMSNTSVYNIEKELNQNSTALHNITDKIPDILAYPSGQFNQETVDYLQNSSVKYAVTTVAQMADFSIHDPLILPRFKITGSFNLEKFKEILLNNSSYKIYPTTTTTVVPDEISNF